MSDFVLHFDGSCGPKNPGPHAGYGYTSTKDGVSFAKDSGELKDATFSNNYAEFHALYKGLEHIGPILTQSDRLFIRGDSQLVINVMSKRWRAKDGIYYPAYLNAAKELTRIRSKNIFVSIDWVPREMNTQADALSTAYSK